MKIRASLNRAFTLVELMVVIAIIVVMTGIILVSLQGAKSKSRDGQRISDLGQIQLALEQYFDRCGQYPKSANDTSGAMPLGAAYNGCPSGITFSNYLPQVPVAPDGKPYAYFVPYNITGTTNYSSFVLQTTLEKANPAQANSLQGTNEPTYACHPSSGSGQGVGCYTPGVNIDALDYCVSSTFIPSNGGTACNI